MQYRSFSFKQAAKEQGIYQWERYIDTERNTKLLKNAILRVYNGISPGR